MLHNGGREERGEKKRSQAPEMKLHARDICISFMGKVNRSKCKVKLFDERLSNAKPTLIFFFFFNSKLMHVLRAPEELTRVQCLR